MGIPSHTQKKKCKSVSIEECSVGHRRTESQSFLITVRKVNSQVIPVKCGLAFSFDMGSLVDEFASWSRMTLNF